MLDNNDIDSLLLAQNVSRETFLRMAPNVSRETFSRLCQYKDLLARWNKSINLVSVDSLLDVWERHIFDSLQLQARIASNKIVMDMGSGAGFPGLMLSIGGVTEVHLVESDARKALFLNQASKISANKITIHQKRVEALPPFTLDYITARACAQIGQILEWSSKWHAQQPEYWLLKGASVDNELEQAASKWNFTANTYPSLSSPSGILVQLTKVARK